MSIISWFFPRFAGHMGSMRGAESQIPTIKAMYRLKTVFPLHNPVDIPGGAIQKAPDPTVAWLNRWDRVKRPELFLELPAKFAHIRFIAAGVSKDKGPGQILQE